ncbi:MAG: hypothetical protein ACHP93_07295 [Solirubrobacterales bacterium]
MSALTTGAGAGAVLGLVFVLLAQQLSLIVVIDLGTAMVYLVVGIILGAVIGGALGSLLGRRYRSRHLSSSGPTSPAPPVSP